MDSTERCQKRTNVLTTRFGKINVNKNTFLRLTNKIRIPKKKYSIQKLKKKMVLYFSSDYLLHKSTPCCYYKVNARYQINRKQIDSNNVL